MSRRFSIVVVALAVASCARSSRLAGEHVLVWPPAARDPGIDCVSTYPDGLGDRAFAFDGTVIEVTHGDYDRDAGARPVDLRLRLHEVFRGDLGDVVSMHTWDFMLPDHDVTGTRVLAAAGPTLDVMACGYTRPYSEEDAQYWRRVFGSNDA